MNNLIKIYSIFCFIFLISSFKTYGQNFHGGFEDGYVGSNLVNYNFNDVPESFFVIITLADGQLSPSNSSVINFTATFNKSTSDFVFSDIDFGGTANPTNIEVSGGPLIYNIAVSGMTQSGTVNINISEGVCTDDEIGSFNPVSINTQNEVIYDNQPPIGTISLASGQLDPTNISPLNFQLEFSELVSGLENEDVLVGGTAGATTVALSGSGDLYNVAVSGMTQDGIVSITLPDAVCSDLAGNANGQSVYSYNSVNYHFNGPKVTFNQGASQPDPINVLPIVFDVQFNKDIVDFSFNDIEWTGTASGINGTIAGTGSNYTVQITEVSSEGSLIGSIPPGCVFDLSGLSNAGSTSTDSSVTYDISRPGVDIVLDPLQQNPTNADIISFSASFTEDVFNFNPSDVELTGNAGANNVYIRGGPQNYTLDISGMLNPGDVTVNINSDVVNDLAGNTNTASVNIENTIVYDNVKPDVLISSTVTNPTSLSEIPLNIAFSKQVDGFEDSDINISNGTLGSFNEINLGISWDLTVVPTSIGTINIQVPADAAMDNAGNSNNASNHFQIEYAGDVSEVFEANNIFTPNSAFNRYWLIKNIEQYSDYELIIRNVAGQVVYETRNYQNDWNGTYNNKPLPTGTYYYFFSNREKVIVYKGFINIIYE